MTTTLLNRPGQTSGHEDKVVLNNVRDDKNYFVPIDPTKDGWVEISWSFDFGEPVVRRYDWVATTQSWASCRIFPAKTINASHLGGEEATPTKLKEAWYA